MRRALATVAVLLATSSAIATRTETPAGPVALSVPGRTNATPSIAATGKFVAIAWGASASAGGTDVHAAVSRDGGETFGAPVRVNDVGGDAKLNGEQPPHIALVPRAGRDPVIAVVWTSKRPAGTVLLRSQSSNGGTAFSPAAVVAGTDAPGNRGWEAIAIDRAGRIDVAWLDHRELAAQGAAMAMAHADHAAASPGTGTEAAQKSKLYVGPLDGTAAPHAITGGVCYCCKTAMAVGKDGATYVAWRHVYSGDLRDIAFAASRDGGRTFSDPVRVSQDGWAINGCPENGPAMVVDDRNAIHVVWPTFVAGPGQTLGLFYARSTDGRTFSPRLRIPADGTPSHVDLALDEHGSLVLVWDQLKDGSRHIMMSRRSAADPAAEFARPTVLPSSAGGSFPVAAGVPGAAVVAWTSATPDTSVIRVQRVPSSAVH